MTTLKTKQVQFLKDYTLMRINDQVNDQLKALRKSDEWNKAIEEGEKDAKILKDIEERKQDYLNRNKLFDLNEQVIALGKDLNSGNNKHFIGYNYGNVELEEAWIEKVSDEDIEKRLASTLKTRAENYAYNKTGYVYSWNCRWNDRGEKIHKEIDARLSVSNLDNFDAIVEGMLSHFNIDEIVQTITEDNKECNDECEISNGC